MITYDNLNPMAPSQQEVNLQNYCVAKISKVQVDFQGEIGKRQKLAKKMIRLATISNAVGTD